MRSKYKYHYGMNGLIDVILLNPIFKVAVQGTSYRWGLK
jgi:hypothetical protein